MRSSWEWVEKNKNNVTGKLGGFREKVVFIFSMSRASGSDPGVRVFFSGIHWSPESEGWKSARGEIKTK